MDARNENPRSSRGQRTAVCSDGPDPITTLQGKSQRDRARALLRPLRAEHRVIAEYRPLSLGIRGALHAAVHGARTSSSTAPWRLHCHSDAYLQAIAAGGPRYTLDAAPSGEVCEEHRVAAVLVLARRAEKSVKPPNPPRMPVASNAAPKLPLLRLAKPGRRL